MARDPDRDVEPAARDAGEEGTPQDAGVRGDELTDESATWSALPPGGAPPGAGEMPQDPPPAPRQPPAAPEQQEAVLQRSELSPTEPRGFAVTAWVWLIALVALGLGILVALWAA